MSRDGRDSGIFTGSGSREQGGSMSNWTSRGAVFSVIAAAVLATASAGAITKTLDRKFPLPQWCPLESRGPALGTIDFQALGPAARITFTVENLRGECDGQGGKPCSSNCDCNTQPCDPNDQFPQHFCQKSCTNDEGFGGCPDDEYCLGQGVGPACGKWNHLLLDNVTVALRDSVFLNHLVGPIPGNEGPGGCYQLTIPYPGGIGGMNDAPAYDFNSGPQPIFKDLFDTDPNIHGWSGDLYWDLGRTAPRAPAGTDPNSLDFTGGSLSVGKILDGSGPVSASFVVSGLSPNQWYVVFAWWSIELPDTVTMTINPNVCPDADGDHVASCVGGCDPDGLPCGDCNDSLPHCTTTCADGDGDGWCTGTDCNDSLPTCGADCVADLDADAITDCVDSCIDADGDLHGAPGGAGNTCLGTDCDETRTSVYAGAPQLCDGLNNDCLAPGYPAVPANEADADADGYRICAGDCKDADPSVHPGIPDVPCNGIDDDCSGQVDETFPAGCQCSERGTGLVGWWQAEGTAANQSGINNGTLMGTAAFAAGKVGQAFSLDGAGWVEMADASAFEVTSQVTLEAWIRPDDLTAYRQIISKFGSSGGYAYQIGVTPTAQLRADVSGNGTTYSPITSPAGTLSTGVWAHVAMTFNAGDVRLYINGNLVNSLTFPIPTIFSAGTTKPTIGRDPIGIQYFVGLIDEATIYNRALSPSEIQVIYAAGASGMCPCRDGDRDGYGSQAGVLCYGGTQLDCNDTIASRNPGAPELCNGIDDDCDTLLDDGLTQVTFYRDLDNDTYGTPATTIQACAAPSGYVANDDDCDDTRNFVYPGAVDAGCDLIDQDCDGVADEDFISPPNIWISTPTTGSTGRSSMTMVGTGNTVIVWGGNTSATFTNTGQIYRPADFTPLTYFWTPTPIVASTPEARVAHTAVWTGIDMIVWGGSGISTPFLATGGRYRLSNNSWTPTTVVAGTPSPRNGHTAVWTGSKMIIWGGTTASGLTNTGSVYDPNTGVWTAMTLTGAPLARSGHTAVWTGTEMLVWGGYTGSPGFYYSNGGRYNPTTNTWTAIPNSPLAGRDRPTAVWTGTQMIIWGGVNGSNLYADGAIYDLGVGNWVLGFTSLPTLGARYGHSAVWDPVDGKMLIWGGAGLGSARLNDGAGYDPVAHTWTLLPTTALPARSGHAAVWLPTTSEMLVWGGELLNTGARIVPYPYTCGTGGCQRSSSYTCTAGLSYGCTAGLPSTEICNSIDDNCDGSTDNGIPAPSGASSLDVGTFGGAAQLFWTAVPGVTGYDIVGGSLTTLASSAGNFTNSTTLCMANDVSATTAPDTSPTPAPGAGFWYLIRGVNSCSGNASYDEPDPDQQGLRDAEIAASVAACP